MRKFRKATEGQLFGIDYGPLLRAIHHVLFVNKMADATAAEAKRSAHEYDQAREELSGYQIVLDLLVAKHFGYPTAAGLLEHGRELDLSSRERFLASLEAAAPTKKGERPAVEVVQQVSDLACRGDLRFFHWDIEFPEVFFGFKDANQRQIEHKDDLVEGTAGFDAVVGNPPYVSSLDLKRILSSYEKPFWKTRFESASGAYDLYILFLELAAKLHRNGGRGSLITPNKYLAAPYGVALRRFVHKQEALHRLWDVSRVPVFDDPSVYPVVTILWQAAKHGSDSVIVDQSIGCLEEVRQYLHDRDSLTQLPELIWGFLLSEQAELLSRVVKRSTPLGSVCKVNASSTAGESDTFTDLIDEMPSRNPPRGWRIVNTGLIDRYRLLWGEQAMAHSGWQVDRPYLFDDPDVVSSNRRSQYDQPKIVFAKVARRLEAAFDSAGELAAVNVNFAFATGDEAYFYLALLNSQLMSWVYSQYFSALRMSGGYLQFQAPQLRVLPVLRYADVAQNEVVEQIVFLSRRASADTGQIEDCSLQIDQLIYHLYGLSTNEIIAVDACP